MRPTIRLAVASDAEAIANIYAPIVINTAISFETVPPSESEMQNRISGIISTFPWLVCQQQDRICGYAYASTHRARPAYQWSVDVSVYVDQTAHRTGIGRALYTALFEILALQGYYNVFAGITLPNAGSVGLHESFGFRPIAVYKNVGHKLGRWHDVGWWQLELKASTGIPELPKSICEVKDWPSFQLAVENGSALLKDI